VADPDRLVVVSGFTQGLALTCHVLRDRGVRRVAVEDPGWFAAREIVRRVGLDIVGVPVDDEGLRVDLVPGDAGAVLVTPAHQCPTGVPLSPARRAALVAWTRLAGGVVLEDDYDAEYRYDREPVGTLQGLDPEHVVYLGSASKILAPALRLGWVLAPPQLAGALAEQKALTDWGTPVLEQLTLARFLADGDLDRHLRRTRAHYRGRRDALFAALARHVPDAEVEGVPAGLYVTVRLPPGTDEAALLRAGRDRGIGVYARSWYAVDPLQAAPGLVLGYGSVAEPEIAWGIDQLGRARADVAAAAGAGRPAISGR
jgi:GntR family transcriptional regulator/MocR family aminotransferase